MPGLPCSCCRYAAHSLSRSRTRQFHLVDGIGQASVVVTREFSDWSTLRGITTKEPLSWRILRKGASLEVLYSLDGKHFISTRLGYLSLQAAADAGVMCCSPEGSGFDALRRTAPHSTFTNPVCGRSRAFIRCS